MFNCIFRLAFRSMRKYKKRTIYLFLIILFNSALLFGALGYIDSQIKQTSLNNIKDYGSYYYAIEKLTESQKLQLSQNPYITKENKVFFYGEFELGSLGYSNDISLLPVTLLEGNYPIRENEIAISKTTLLQMLYPIEINQEIEVKYELLNGEEISQTFTVCGIYEISSKFQTNFPVILTAQKDVEFYENYYYITKSHKSFLNDYEVIKNSNVIPSELENQMSITYAKQGVVAAISIIGIVLIMYSISLIASDISDELSMLRMLGASKMQVALLFYSQLGILSIIAIPLGFIVGLVFCLWICQASASVFYFSMFSFWYVLVVLLGTLLIGSALPIIVSTQNALGKNKYRKLNKDKLKSLKRITIFNITKRHMRFQKHSYLLFLILAVTCMTIFSSRLLNIQRILSQQKFQSEYSNIRIEVVDSTIPITQNVVDDIENIEGVRNLVSAGVNPILPTLKCTLNYQDVYNGVYGSFPIQADVSISANYDLPENEVMIYLPKYYIKVEGDKILSYPESLGSELEGYEIVQESRIKVGDKIILNGEEMIISSILTEDDSIYMYTQPYTIFVSEEWVINHQIEESYDSCKFTIDHGYDLDVVYSNISKVLRNNYNGYVTVTVEDVDERNMIPQIIVQCINAIGMLIFVVILLFQKIYMQSNERYKDMCLFFMIGMDKSQMRQMYLWEGFLLSSTICISHFLIQLFPHFMTAVNQGSLSEFKIMKVFSTDILFIYLIVYIVVFALVLFIYYSASNRFFKVHQLKNLDKMK